MVSLHKASGWPCLSPICPQDWTRPSTAPPATSALSSASATGTSWYVAARTKPEHIACLDAPGSEHDHRDPVADCRQCCRGVLAPLIWFKRLIRVSSNKRLKLPARVGS